MVTTTDFSDERPTNQLGFAEMREECHTRLSRGGQTENSEVPNVIMYGSSVTFHSELYDATGKHVGVSDGIAVVYADPDDGSMRQVCSATDTFADGTVFWSGTYPMFPARDSRAVPAVGMSGRYTGHRGMRHFQLLERPDATKSLIRSRLLFDD